MELEVNSEAVAVETVEVVAGGDDSDTSVLMEQQLMAANAHDLIVSSPEVRVYVLTVVYLQHQDCPLPAALPSRADAGGYWVWASTVRSPLCIPASYHYPSCGNVAFHLAGCADRQQEKLHGGVHVSR